MMKTEARPRLAKTIVGRPRSAAKHPSAETPAGNAPVIMTREEARRLIESGYFADLGLSSDEFLARRHAEAQREETS